MKVPAFCPVLFGYPFPSIIVQLINPFSSGVSCRGGLFFFEMLPHIEEAKCSWPPRSVCMQTGTGNTCANGSPDPIRNSKIETPCRM